MVQNLAAIWMLHLSKKRCNRSLNVGIEKCLLPHKILQPGIQELAPNLTLETVEVASRLFPFECTFKMLGDFPFLFHHSA